MKNSFIRMNIILLSVSCSAFFLSGCSVFEGQLPMVTSRVYIVDNIFIKDPCVVEKDSTLYVVKNKSKIHSVKDIPDFYNNRTLRDDVDFYQLWYPRNIDQTPMMFFISRRLHHPGRIWGALDEVYNDNSDSFNYYSESIMSNLRQVWNQDGVILYDFIKRPKSFLLVLMQDCEIDGKGFEGGFLALDVAPEYVSRAYQSYVCPVQKRYKVRL